MVDKVWEEIKKKVAEKKVLKWYVMTPVNYDFFKSSFGTKLSKKKISQIMKKRYKWMLEKGEKLELHVHLSIIKDMSLNDQEKRFNEAMKWFKDNLGFKPKEFAPGWWAYNKETESILKKYDLKLIKYKDYNSTHDYHWVI